MILPNDILDRLKEMIEEKFPGETVYTNLTPSDFVRPSTLIVQDGCDVDVSMGTKLIEMRPTFTLTTFVEVDEYHHSHLSALDLRQMKLVSLLIPGYIKIGDRAPKVAAINLGGGYDYDTVTVTFRYTLDRREFEESKLVPIMGELHLKKEVITYG